MPLPMYTTPAEKEPSTAAVTGESVTTSTNSNTTAAAGQGEGASTGSAQKSEAELAAEKLYEERMEEEYAKREGGA